MSKRTSQVVQSGQLDGANIKIGTVQNDRILFERSFLCPNP